MNVKQKVITYMHDNAMSSLPTGEEKGVLECYYLDQGVIDSIGIINMITSFESEFDISFEAEDMQSYDFQTVGGLIRIIESKMAKK